MIEVFGKQYRLDTLIFCTLFIFSAGIICLNIFYSLKFGTEIVNLNMGAGIVLIIYSGLYLFNK